MIEIKIGKGTSQDAERLVGREAFPIRERSSNGANGSHSTLLVLERRTGALADSARPLAVLQRSDVHKLTDTQMERLDKLWSYNISHITRKLVSRGDAPQIKAEQLYPLEAMLGKIDLETARSFEAEFKRFMSIILIKPENVKIVAPSRPVDMYWHLFVLDTREYRKFCEQVFGRFIDHVPSSDARRQHTRDAYVSTLDAYNKLFGVPDGRIWPKLRVEGANCGTGSGHCSGGPDCNQCNAG